MDLYSTRVAGAWIETRIVGDGFGVISFYVVSGANTVAQKKLATERFLMALLCYIGQHRHRPLFICSDANLHLEKSEVMQAMCQTGWVDLAENLGNTFRVDPHGRDANSKIDFVFASPDLEGWWLT